MSEKPEKPEKQGGTKFVSLVVQKMSICLQTYLHILEGD